VWRRDFSTGATGWSVDAAAAGTNLENRHWVVGRIGWLIWLAVGAGSRREFE